MDSGNRLESSSYVDESIAFTIVQQEVNMSSLHQSEEKEITKLFHIKIQVNKTKVDALFDSG
jgi:hypothetical protein